LGQTTTILATLLFGKNGKIQIS